MSDESESESTVRNEKMISKLLLSFVLVLLSATTLFSQDPQTTPSEPWISHYSGDINMETEMAHLDNFAVQVMNDPNLIGYIVIYSGADSCQGEAEARVSRMMKYLIDRRGVPWNRIMWKHVGRFKGKGLEVFHLGIPANRLSTTSFSYEPPAPGRVIRKCPRVRKPWVEIG